MNLNSNDYEKELSEIERQSLHISDPLDPRMSKVFYLYAVIAFKKIENILPFQDITKEFNEINMFLLTAAEICEEDQLLVKIYSLIGDLHAFVDQVNIAEISYREAISKSRNNEEILQLYVALLQLRIMFLQNDNTEELIKEAKQLAFQSDSPLLDTIFKLEEEWIISKSDTPMDMKKEQSDIKVSGQKYQQMKNLGVFGSQKKSLLYKDIL